MIRIEIFYWTVTTFRIMDLYLVKVYINIVYHIKILDFCHVEVFLIMALTQMLKWGIIPKFREILLEKF